MNDPLKYDVLSEYRNTTHNSSILVISNIVATDVGDYECEVKNTIGKAHTSIHVSFLPESPIFEKIEHEGETVTTNWRIRSLQSLTEVMLNYKKSGVSRLEYFIPIEYASIIFISVGVSKFINIKKLKIIQI